MNVVNEIFDLFAVRGCDAYLGEPISQTEHALQAAHLARQAGVVNRLIVAALLHDIGHLLHPISSSTAPAVDGRHEQLGAAWLGRWFGPEVTEPVKLHVAAKRYLCRVESPYMSGLSLASIHSLELQGGPLSWPDAAAFEKNPHFEAAVLLRRWDDRAKLTSMEIPRLDSYRETLRYCLQPG